MNMISSTCKSQSVCHNGVALRASACHSCIYGQQEDRSAGVTMHLSTLGDARVLYPDAAPEPPALQVLHDAIEAVLQPSAMDSGLRLHAEKADHANRYQKPPQITGTGLPQLSRTPLAAWTVLAGVHTQTALLHLSNQTVDVATDTLGLARTVQTVSSSSNTLVLHGWSLPLPCLRLLLTACNRHAGPKQVELSAHLRQLCLQCCRRTTQNAIRSTPALAAFRASTCRDRSPCTFTTMLHISSSDTS